MLARSPSIPLRAFVFALLGAPVAACGPNADEIEPGSDTGSGTEGGGTTGGTDAGATGADPDDSGAGSSGEVSTTGPGEPVDYARGGISIAGVTINQGIQIAVANGGHWLGPDERTQRIAKGRRTLLRVYWDVPDDWEPRELEGRLALEYADGSTRTLRETRLVDTNSHPSSLELTFSFGLEPDQVEPGMKFQASIHETDAAYEALPAPEEPPVSPDDGVQFLGVESADMVLEVVMVPVLFDSGGCRADSADVLADPATVDSFRNALFVQNPVQEVDLKVHPTSIDFTDYTYGDGFAPLLAAMQRMRREDDAPPSTHYFALLNRCGSGGHDGAGGYAYLGGRSPETDNQRVSAGLWCPGCGYDWSEYTFVHEVGHSQGMSHVGCGTWGHEPEPGGVAGVWGFDVLNIELKHPDRNYEYMSYCRPNWMSQWTWTFTWETIQALSAFEETENRPPEGEALFGILMPSGKELWTRTSGSINPVTLRDDAFVDFYDGDRHLGQQPAAVGLFDDGKTRYVNVNIPPGPDAEAITHLQVTDPQGARHVVYADAVTDIRMGLEQ